MQNTMKNLSEFYEEIPSLTSNRFWRPEDVRQACIRNNLYGYGTVKQYEKMLGVVSDSDPTIEMVYLAAKDIFEKSIGEDPNGQTISNIMYILESEAVYTTFLINGREDI